MEESKFTTDGCVFTIAAAETATRLSLGRDIKGCLLINRSAILNVLKRMPADHKHCALLTALTFQKAVKDFKDRKSDKAGQD